MKDFFVRQIKKTAEHRLDQELIKFAQTCNESPILSRLEINLTLGTYKFMNQHGRSPNSVFNNWHAGNLQTNFEKIKTELLEKYTQEAEDEIMKKLESISYLFEEARDGE